MTTDFRIDITASDKATATFKKVGSQVDKIMQPIGKAQKALDNVGNAKGLERRARDIDAVGRSLANVAKIGESAGLRIPLLGTLGGGFALGAGLQAFTEAMRESSTQATKVLRFTQQHGMQGRDIQRLTAAAAREGIDEDTAQQVIGDFGSRLQDAATGRDGGMGRMLLERAGVKLQKNADGSPKTEQALLDLADAVKRQPNPESATYLARQFGLGQLLPLLQEGSTRIRQFGDDAERTGQIMSKEGVASLDAYGRALDKLSGSLKGLRKDWTAESASVLAPGIDTLATGIDKAGQNTPKRGLFDTMLLPLRTLLGAFEMGQAMSGVQPKAPGRRSASGVVTEPGAASITQFGAGIQRLGAPGRSEYRVDPDEQRGRDSERMRILKQELDKEQDPTNRAALMREIGATQALDAKLAGQASAGGGAPAAASPQQSVKVEVAVSDDRTRTKVTQSGGGAMPSTRIAYAMPASGAR